MDVETKVEEVQAKVEEVLTAVESKVEEVEDKVEEVARDLGLDLKTVKEVTLTSCLPLRTFLQRLRQFLPKSKASPKVL